MPEIGTLGFDVAGAGNVLMGTGLRPGAKATEHPPDPTGGAPAPDPTVPEIGTLGFDVAGAGNVLPESGGGGGGGGAKGNRPAARLRKHRMSHRIPTGYAPPLDSTGTVVIV